MEKINSAIHKLKQTVMKPGVMYLYFNVYLLKSVFFGYQIVKLSIKQEEKLQKKHKATILQKMKLRITFPGAVLYSRRNVIGIGLIRSKMVIVIQAYKLYFGNLRAQMRIARIIRINEEAIIIKFSRGK